MAIAEHVPMDATYPGNERYPAHEPSGDDLAAHLSTYRAFVRYTALFTAHVAVILALMAYFLV